jgi:CHASE2 domain-containing sensor protein
MKTGAYRRISARDADTSRRRDPIAEMSSIYVTGSAIGVVLSVGLFVIVWGFLPVVRPFLVAALAVGAIVGLVLWLRHR